MILTITIPFVLFMPSPEACAQSVPDSLEQALSNRKQALELEVRFARKNPDAYYLVIDLPSRKFISKPVRTS